LVFSSTNANVPGPGSVGIGDKHGGTFWGNGSNVVNFEFDPIATPSLPFSDSFNRSALSGLANDWSVDQGGFSLAGNQAVAAALSSGATLYGTSLTTVDESADIVTQGTAAGLMARWNSATMTGYSVRFSGTSLKLFSVVNGVSTQIGTTATTATTTGTVRLTISGSTLQVFFNGTLMINVTDSTITGAGSVGIFSAGNSAFDSFSVSGS
jgi:hypothetical protein